jgi:hypothetical protein
MRKRWIAITAATVALAAPAAANAESMVFIKGGNVWIAHANGNEPRQLTTGGGWAHPTQADDGTILAKRGGGLVRMTHRGVQLGDPIYPEARTAVFDPEISPDGTKVAYWDLRRVGDPQCSVASTSSCKRVIVASAADGRTLYSGMDGIYHPTWIDEGRLLVFNDSATTFVKRLGAPGAPDAWFFVNGLTLSQGEWMFTNGRIALLSEGSPDSMWLYRANGNPPALPTFTCSIVGVQNGYFAHPKWWKYRSPLLYEDEDGIWMVSIGRTSPGGPESCSPRLIAPGATDPDPGPTYMSTEEAPAPPIEPPPPSRGDGQAPQPSAPAPSVEPPSSPTPTPPPPVVNLRETLSRGVPFNVKCRRACSAKVALLQGRRVVASGRARLRKRGRVTVVARFSRAARAKLGELGEVTLKARIDIRERGRKVRRTNRRLTLVGE